MFNIVIEMMSYPFIQRAMIVGILITLSAALIGVTLVLKRYSMIGDRFITCRIWRIDCGYIAWNDISIICFYSNSYDNVNYFIEDW